MNTPIAKPEFASNTFRLAIERTMAAPSNVLFKAWTEQFDRWFAAPETVLMRPEVNAPFFLQPMILEQLDKAFPKKK